MPTFTPDVQRALDHVRRLLGMSTAFVAELVRHEPPEEPAPDELVIRYLDGDTQRGRITTGTRWALADTVARRVLERDRPLAIADLAERPRLAGGTLARQMHARAYIGVPLVLSTGERYGILCCFATRPDPRLRNRDAELLNLVADLIIDTLEHQRSDLRLYSQTADVIRRALEPGALRPTYQPIVDLDAGRVVGHEALSRFPRPPDWTPDIWFAAARSIGCGVELEVAAIEAALQGRPQIPGCYLALNVSPATLVSPDLRAAFAGRRLDDVVFEITEHEDYEVSPSFIAGVDQWRAAGARIAIDDAGSGYAGLHQVLHLRPDILKLDQALVRGADGDPVRQALARSLAWFARLTGAQLIAEGIETAAELDIMHALGVGFGQGFHLGRPAPAGRG